MFRPTLVAVAVVIAVVFFPMQAPAADDSGGSKDTKAAKPTKMDKKLKKGSKTEKREKADTKKDSLSPAGGAGPVPAY